MLNYERIFDFPEKMDLIPIMTDDLLDDFLKSADAKQLQILSVRKTGKYKNDSSRSKILLVLCSTQLHNKSMHTSMLRFIFR